MDVYAFTIKYKQIIVKKNPKNKPSITLIITESNAVIWLYNSIDL